MPFVTPMLLCVERSDEVDEPELLSAVDRRTTLIIFEHGTRQIVRLMFSSKGSTAARTASGSGGFSPHTISNGVYPHGFWWPNKGCVAIHT
mmetsp:Transcript_20993/g.38486  ORF Transcript_20993/g.38486 Transcript_20993/m.38486 type:complete len:91 (-) Transcript_20993:62-334(-)